MKLGDYLHPLRYAPFYMDGAVPHTLDGDLDKWAKNSQSSGAKWLTWLIKQAGNGHATVSGAIEVLGAFGITLDTELSTIHEFSQQLKIDPDAWAKAFGDTLSFGYSDLPMIDTQEFIARIEVQGNVVHIRDRLQWCNDDKVPALTDAQLAECLALWKRKSRGLWVTPDGKMDCDKFAVKMRGDFVALGLGAVFQILRIQILKDGQPIMGHVINSCAMADGRIQLIEPQDGGRIVPMDYSAGIGSSNLITGLFV